MIFMLQGWKDSPGAQKEFEFACDSRVPILFEKPEMYQNGSESKKAEPPETPSTPVNTKRETDSNKCGGELTVELVKAMYTDAEGATIEKAAAELGVHKSTLYRFVTDNGLLNMFWSVV